MKLLYEAAAITLIGKQDIMEINEHLKLEAIVSAVLTVAVMQKAPPNPGVSPLVEAVATYKQILGVFRSSDGPLAS